MSAPNVRLTTPGRLENVALIREALAGIAETIHLTDEQLDDIKTAASEAANNVVIHAYDGSHGPLELDATVLAGRLQLIVRDEGRGVVESPPRDTAAHLGLAVIRALAERTELRAAPGAGTEVLVEFDCPHDVALPAPRGAPPLGERPIDRDLVVALAPSALARRVLSRLLAALAARAQFSIDRISDTQMLGDALASTGLLVAGDEHLVVRVDAAPRRLELTLGPLRRGSFEALAGATRTADLGTLARRLADDVASEQLGDAELLRLVLRDERRQRSS